MKLDTLVVKPIRHFEGNNVCFNLFQKNITYLPALWKARDFISSNFNWWNLNARQTLNFFKNTFKLCWHLWPQQGLLIIGLLPSKINTTLFKYHQTFLRFDPLVQSGRWCAMAPFSNEEFLFFVATLCVILYVFYASSWRHWRVLTKCSQYNKCVKVGSIIDSKNLVHIASESHCKLQMNVQYIDIQ